MTVKERIAALRDKMRANGIDAYIVFDSDEHMSEYLPEYYRERSWISGFTGSAGTVVVTQQEAGLWTDGRYYLQAASQLSGSGVTLFRASDAGVISLTDYLFKSVASGGTIALNGRVASTAMVLELREKCAVNDITLRTDLRLVDELWTEDRPALPSRHGLCLSRGLCWPVGPQEAAAGAGKDGKAASGLLCSRRAGQPLLALQPARQ